MDKIKKFFSQLKYELSLMYNTNKEDIISLCVCIALMFIAIGIIIFAVVYTEIFFSIAFSIICGIIIVMTEMNVDTDYSNTKYPLLKRIKNGLIRYVLYPIYVSITCLIVYILSFR